MKQLQDNSIDLIIADPPYFRILQEKWDRYKTFDEYLNWSKEYLSLCVNKLRLSGTLLLYGCSRSFSTLCELNRILLDNGMYFVEEIILDKGMKSVAGRISNKIKMYPTVSENILVYRKDAKPFVKQLLKQKQSECNLSVNEIKTYLGMALNGGGNWTKYCGDTEFPLLPTEEYWLKLCELFKINIQYRDIEEVYNGQFGLTNVWNDINFYIKNRIHPSEKPLILSERLVNTFSRENDLVYIPFAGSGSEIEACINCKRYYLATEISEEYIENIKKRIA
jgi:DNA modification methylase